LFKAPEAIPYD